MPVVRHENIGENTHIELLAHFIQKILEVLIHPIFLKNGGSAIRVINRMVDKITDIDA
jgi:hypothetical protein